MGDVIRLDDYRKPKVFGFPAMANDFGLPLDALTNGYGEKVDLSLFDPPPPCDSEPA